MVRCHDELLSPFSPVGLFIGQGRAHETRLGHRRGIPISIRSTLSALAFVLAAALIFAFGAFLAVVFVFTRDCGRVHSHYYCDSR